MYQLADNYIRNSVSVEYYQDRHRALQFQEHCYRALRELILLNHCNNVLDLGCGHWIKLYKFVYPVVTDITGVDLAAHIAQNGLAPFGTFIGHDLDKDVLFLDQKFDIIVASDIIEHLKNPDNLMLSVKNALREDGFVLFSTPDRSYRHTSLEGGPFNRSHVQEWSEDEFRTYLDSSGFEVLNIFRSQRQSHIYFCKMKGS